MFKRFKNTTALAALIGLAAASDAIAQAPLGIGQIDIGVTAALAPTDHAQNTQISSNFSLRLLVTATDPLENPGNIITRFGELSTGVDTVPDIHTYLKLPRNPGGPEASYDYGRRFLFQGHENSGDIAYITRINLDVTDPAHRITLLTPVDAGTLKTGLNRIDGSSFDPFTERLLFTEENEDANSNGAGKLHELTLDFPAQHNTLEAFVGLGGFEGVHPDDKGNIYLVEDIGGRKTPAGTTANVDGVADVLLKGARQPNSFVYRYVPNNPRRLQDGGKLQALQVLVNGQPVVFGGTASSNVIADIIAPAQRSLYTPGIRWPFKWITVHESKKDATTAFNATQAAKDAGATPFKRPENMAWLPDSRFRTFYFSATGDTDRPTGEVPQLAARGAWGAIIKVTMDERPSDDVGHSPYDGNVSTFLLGDADHAAFDNLAFANRDQLLAAEDRGDNLHDQLKKLDSVWAFNVRNNRSLRFVALGADERAWAVGKDDNEPTGVIVSNGSPRKDEMVGTLESLETSRGFITQQHGFNNVYEFYKNSK